MAKADKSNQPLTYLAELKKRLGKTEVTRDRTRARILLAVAEVLSTDGYHDAIVRQVCERLRISRGAFYQYFDNRTDAVAEVLNDFCNFVYRMSVGIGRGKSDFERISEVTYFYIQTYTRNKGLFAIQYRLARGKSPYSKGWRELQDKWRNRLTRYILRVTDADSSAHRHALALSYMLTSLADDLLYRLIFENEEQLRWLNRHPRQMAVMISIVWYRAIFGKDPAMSSDQWPRLSYSGTLPFIAHG